MPHSTCGGVHEHFILFKIDVAAKLVIGWARRADVAAVEIAVIRRYVIFLFVENYINQFVAALQSFRLIDW